MFQDIEICFNTNRNNTVGDAIAIARFVNGYVCGIIEDCTIVDFEKNDECVSCHLAFSIDLDEYNAEHLHYYHFDEDDIWDVTYNAFDLFDDFADCKLYSDVYDECGCRKVGSDSWEYDHHDF